MKFLSLVNIYIDLRTFMPVLNTLLLLRFHSRTVD